MWSRLLIKVFKHQNIYPEYITLFVTSACNCFCKHCFWRSENTVNRSDDLTLAEIKKLSASMPSFLVLALSGGEPFLRKDLAEIVQLFYQQNKIRYLSIPTNGTVMAQETIENIVRLCPKLKVQIMVSIDDIGTRHDNLRGRIGTFNQAVVFFRNLKKEFRNRILVGTVTVVSVDNQSRIKYIYKWIKDNLQPDFMNFPLIRGSSYKELVEGIDLKQYRYFMQMVFDEEKPKIIRNAKAVMTKIGIRTINKQKRLLRCLAGNINAVIYQNGDVFPCELFTKSMGNLRDFDCNFNELWWSDQSKMIRKTISRGGCFCFHGCNMLPNVIFNGKLHLIILISYLRSLWRLVKR